MIGISTEQNTTNLIPAIQCGVSEFLIIETSYANSQKWADGFKEVLEKRQIHCDKIILNSNEDSDIIAISEKIKTKIKDKESCIWNVGGGQKPQQFAIWQVFQERKNKDKICYANPATKNLEWWEYKEEKLKNRLESIDVILTAAEILKTFGYVIKENAKTELIYKKGQATIILKKEIKDLLKYDEFREFLFRLPAQNFEQIDEDLKYNINEIKNILQNKSENIISYIKSKILYFPDKNNVDSFSRYLKNSIFLKKEKDKIIKGEFFNIIRGEIAPVSVPIDNKELKNKLNINKLNVSKDTLKNISNFDRTAFYFEQIIVQRIKQLLDTTEHKVIEAYANLEIAKQTNQGEQAAEYDVFCVTNRGTLFAFDAKTFDFEKKDSDARLHNLSQAGGRYVNFYPVIPYDLKDVNKDFFPKKLKELPEKLTKRGIKFYVVADNENDNFKIVQNNNIIERSEGNQAIECKILNENALKS